MEVEKDFKLNKWNGVFHYTSCSIVSTVGLGNIWKLPKLSYSNGGGTVLLMYFIATIIVGFPLYYTEVALGQFPSKTNTEVYKSFAPSLIGIAWSQTFIAFISATYMSALASYTLYYLLISLEESHPWSECPNTTTSTCVSFQDWNSSSINASYTLSEELFFRREVLLLKTDKKVSCLSPEPNLWFCLTFVSVLICVLLIDGVKMDKYRSYCMASIPYFLMLIIVAKMTYLEGAVHGTNRYFMSNWSSLIDPKDWYQAITESIFFLSLGVGTVTTLGGYNKFYYHSKTLCVFIVLFQVLTNVLFGMTNYGIIGHMEFKLNTTFTNVSIFGPWIIFVAYPCVLGQISSYLTIFYFTMFIFALGNIFGMLVVVTTHLQYYAPIFKPWHSAIIVSALTYFMSISYMTPGGLYLLETVNLYGMVLPTLILLLASTFTVHYYYGLQNFCWDVEYMSQNKFRSYWRVCWAILNPIILLFAVVYTVTNLTCTPYDINNFDIYQFLGWMLLLCLLSPLLSIACFTVCNGNKEKNEDESISTNANWKPHDDEKCAEWKELKSIIKRKRDMKAENCFVKFIKTLWRMYE